MEALSGWRVVDSRPASSFAGTTLCRRGVCWVVRVCVGCRLLGGGIGRRGWLPSVGVLAGWRKWAEELDEAEEQSNYHGQAQDDPAGGLIPGHQDQEGGDQNADAQGATIPAHPAPHRPE